MRKIALAAVTALSLWPMATHAGSPVVVELYTSQGCSSCPPADRVLEQLAQHDYVIALSLHVDYWDYLGWKDKFANPAFSARQRRYARTWSERSVYTPQMVVQGQAYMVGSRGDAVQRQIMQHEDESQSVALGATLNGRTASVTVAPISADVGAALVYLVGYADSHDVTIERGELRGRTSHYVNVVESWETIANWDGRSAISISTRNLSAQNYAVIVQEAGQGKILAATRLTN